MPVTMTRRAALIAAAAVPLSACSAGTTNSETTPADPDRIVRDLATRAERALITRYRETVEAYPGLEPELAVFISRHERHLDEMLATIPSVADVDDGATEPGEGDVAPGDIPASQAEAITALREAEAAHSASRIEDSVASYDYELARVFASVAACESAHEHLLGDLA